MTTIGQFPIFISAPLSWSAAGVVTLTGSGELIPSQAHRPACGKTPGPHLRGDPLVPGL